MRQVSNDTHGRQSAVDFGSVDGSSIVCSAFMASTQQRYALSAVKCEHQRLRRGFRFFPDVTLAALGQHTDAQHAANHECVSAA